MSAPNEQQLETERRKGVRAVKSFLLILGIILGTVVISMMLIKGAPRPRLVDDAQPPPAVEVLEITVTDHQTRIFTQGVVESRRETQLASEVTGKVTSISSSLKQGGRVAKGEVVATIEDANYQAALAQTSSALAEAELALSQEQARVKQATLDWQRLGRGAKSNPLVLREPQLRAAEARVASAMAEVRQAQRNVDRTQIMAPFDAAVRTASVEVGTVVQPGQAIAELYSNQDLQVRLPIPLDELSFLERDSNGAAMGTITLQGKLGGDVEKWSATSIELDPQIDRRTLTAHWIVRVLPREDTAYPLPPVGLFVEVEILGKQLENVIVIPRRAVREDQQIAVVDSDQRLAFRKLQIIKGTNEEVVVKPTFLPGDRIILTRLNAPIAGMTVQPASED